MNEHAHPPATPQPGLGPKKLLLWDIDGTLLMGDRAGERALLRALQRVHGIDGTMAGIELAGRTDTFIAGALLQAHGIEPTLDAIHLFLEGYLAELPAELPRGRPRLLPGIVSVLEAVARRPDLAQGLLTGNLERGARVKLEHFDVWRFFPFGAYSDDSGIRNELGPHALRRAHQHHGVAFDPTWTFVIGDTPHDIECGRAMGAMSIAVATGRHAADELRRHHPTAVLDDLSDTGAFLALIDRLPGPPAVD